MTTSKKRVIVYMDESEKQELESVADDMGCSVSRLCSDVILNSLPHLKLTAEALKVARTDPQRAMEMMKQEASVAQERLVKSVAE